MGSVFAARGVARRLVALIVVAQLAACSGTSGEAGKASGHAVEQNAKTLLDREPPKTVDQARAVPPIPDLQPILAAPPPPTIAQRLVTLSVTDPSVPVRDVLLELARKVGVDLDLDQNIGGGIIMTAHERPFIDVIDRICEQANLRYRFKDNVLRVEIDGMYHESYNVDVLNSTRSTTATITNNSNLSTLIQGGGGGGASNTSSSTLQSQSKADTWQEIDDNIKQILINSNPQAQPITSNVHGGAVASVVAVPVPVQPEAAAVASKPAGGDPTMPNAMSSGAEGGVASPTDVGGLVKSAGQLSDLQKRVMTDEPPRPQTAAAAVAAPALVSGQTRYSVNRQAGVVSVFGTSRQQKLVKAYLNKVIDQATAQVLIEAKVVEVTLSDQYNTGVDWQALRQNLQGTGFGISSYNPSTSTTAAIPTLPMPGGLTPPLGGTGFNAAFTTFGGDLAAMINLIRAYGDTRTLSSPRMTVMNNQSAVLKVAENYVYFKLTATVTSTPSTVGSAASQTATYSSQIQTLPIGVVMTVQPSIDLDRDQVTLGLRPTVTAWPGTTVSDPAVALSLASACGSATTSACSQANINAAISSSSVPVVDVREMDSMVTVPSGAVVVMGGLMQQTSNKLSSGVPGAEDAPVVGNLFKSTSDQTSLTELVIFLKATVIHGSDSVAWADKDLYQRYMHDSRPLGF